MNDAIEISNLIYRYAERIGLGGFDALGVLFERALIRRPIALPVPSQDESGKVNALRERQEHPTALQSRRVRSQPLDRSLGKSLRAARPLQYGNP